MKINIENTQKPQAVAQSRNKEETPMTYTEAKNLADVMERIGHLALIVKMPNGTYDVNITHLRNN